MAKALIGFMGGPMNDQLVETARLRRRIDELQAEVMRLQSENDSLNKALEMRIDRLTAADMLESLAH